MVSVDIYLNETTRHANVILPPPRLLATGHYDFALLNFAVRNYARYSPPVMASDGPSEAEILAELITIASGFSGVDDLIIGQMIGDHDPAELDGDSGAERRLDAMLRLGPYGKWNGGDLTLRKLRDEHPHGLDLGPLRSEAPRDPHHGLGPDRARPAGDHRGRRPTQGPARRGPSGVRAHRPPPPEVEQLVAAQHRPARRRHQPVHTPDPTPKTSPASASAIAPSSARARAN